MGGRQPRLRCMRKENRTERKILVYIWGERPNSENQVGGHRGLCAKKKTIFQFFEENRKVKYKLRSQKGCNKENGGNYALKKSF